MSTSLFSKTPTVTVLDNRGLTVRNIAYHRHPGSPDVTSERITRHQYNARGFMTQSADPRLHDAGLANFTYLTDLAGNVLRSQGVDNGTTVSLNDAAGRPFIAVSNISSAGDGTEDRSQAMTRTWQYEDAELPGRPVSITEQVSGEATRIAERFVYASNTDAEKALNLAGQCVSHYDTAGRVQTGSVSLTGVPLSVNRHLLPDEAVTDWAGDNETDWQALLSAAQYTTLTTTDATGAVLTTTDAMSNQQRVAYDVAGQLSGSWLTLKGGTEQIIVKSLTYSAAGQKLREEHGNGVVTTYEYEPETQRLLGMKTERPAGHASGAKILQDLRYEYDPVGNILKITNDAEATRFWSNQKVVPENTYTYDSLYQLVSATGREMANAGQQGSNVLLATVPLPTDSSAYTSYTRTYTCDEAGNLTQVRHTPATGSGYTTRITVSDKSNRGVLRTLTENPAEVDALFTAGGQQTQLQPGQALIWSPRNELLKVTPVVRDGDTDDSESYRYDAGSQRILKVGVQKTGSSVQTQRVFYLPGLEHRTKVNGGTETESLQVITVGEAGRAQVRILHWESGRPDEMTGDPVRYSYDNLTGSSSLELDGEGNIISAEEYYPYGGTAVWTARSAAEADYKTVRYSGKERDATGLYYYGYRYYQPWAGRWLSADPAGTIDGLNLFRMVRNNPVTLKDEDGRMPNDSEPTLQDTSVRPSLLRRLSVAMQHNMPGHSRLDRPLTSDGKPSQRSSFRFSMIKDRLAHFAVSMSLGTVRDSVPRYGGTVTFKFAQTKGTILGEIMKHRDTSGGVCESVSAHWISSHAEGGSIFDKLYTGGQKGEFQIDGLYSIKQLQIDGVQDDVTQALVTKSWLKEHGVEPRLSRSGYPAIPASGKTGSEGVAKLNEAILDTNGEDSEYKMISFSGMMAAHTVAAFVDEQKGVTFFDPNFGEFHFPNKQDFSNWFSNAFWSGSKYNLEIGLGQEFEVHSFKRSATQ